MKCEHCGLDHEVTTTTSETGDISLRGIHDAGGVDCLTRQLAVKSAECERLRGELKDMRDHFLHNWEQPSEIVNEALSIFDSFAFFNEPPQEAKNTQ